VDSITNLRETERERERQKEREKEREKEGMSKNRGEIFKNLHN
jgi:hypothetical protein